jgi:hypothetical protein
MRGWAAWTRGRVNPVVPGIAVLLGAIYAAAISPIIGGGIAAGSILACLNGVVLSRRVDLAAVSGDRATALMVMQVGLFVTLLMIGVATVILIQISAAMALASVASFAVVHLLILATFYWTHGRQMPVAETVVETKV